MGPAAPAGNSGALVAAPKPANPPIPWQLDISLMARGQNNFLRRRKRFEFSHSLDPERTWLPLSGLFNSLYMKCNERKALRPPRVMR
jgi:hypothetical protein